MAAKFPFFISYLNEEIIHFAAIADLLKKDADPNIFKNLGLKYGSAVRFKKEFSSTVAVRAQFHSMAKTNNG